MKKEILRKNVDVKSALIEIMATILNLKTGKIQFSKLWGALGAFDAIESKQISSNLCLSDAVTVPKESNVEGSLSINGMDYHLTKAQQQELNNDLLIKVTLEPGSIYFATGKDYYSEDAIKVRLRSDRYKVESNHDYTISFKWSTTLKPVVWVYEYNENREFIRVSYKSDSPAYSPFTFKTSSTTSYLRFVITTWANSNMTKDPQYNISVNQITDIILE